MEPSSSSDLWRKSLSGWEDTAAGAVTTPQASEISGMASPQPVYLVGPTAVGKSALAVAVAERLGAEIVGADAFQVYAGLDLLTAKPTMAERARVPHHLIGVVPPDELFNVVRYLELARPCLEDVARRGKLALVVGGTGLYVRALTDGLSPLPPARPGLRRELEALDLRALAIRLHSLDPAGVKTVDLANPRRVVRAIEIVETTGRPLSESRARAGSAEHSQGTSRGFLITCPRPELHARIARRTAAMFDGGVVEEVRAFHPDRIGPTLGQALGLADLQAVGRGELPVGAARERLEIGTRQYAKRQLTWFRRDHFLAEVTLDPLSPETIKAAAEAVAARIRWER